MKVLSCTLIVLVTLALSTCSSSSTTRQVLKFGKTVQDYVMFSPDMTYFTSQFSLCSWVKQLKTDGFPYWFHYATTSSSFEIRITDDGYSQMFNHHLLDKRNRLGITSGTWYHYCMCWSSSSRTANVYHNGVKRGSMKTESRRRLFTGGTLVLGQNQYPVGKIYIRSNSHTFGGELFKLNMFSKKFTAAEVRAMYQAGICSEAEKIHGSYRRLTWESILQQTRHGNVQLVEFSGTCSYIDELLAVTQIELEEIRTKLEETVSELEKTQSELETTQTELATLKADLNEKLNLSQSELATKVEFELTKTLLTEFRTELKSIKANLGQRLDQIQNETEETKTKFQNTLAELEETKSKLEETQNELALYSRNSSRSVLQVLKFGTAVGDYIMFSPNMEPFTDQFSLCSWVKKLKSDGQPYWISYATEELNSEIGINVQGLSSIFDDNFDWRRHLDITPGTWFHYCMCWSVSSRTADIYFNGVKAGFITTPLERRLDTGGSLVLGQYQSEDGKIHTEAGNRYTFGGELLKLNIFSKKFSDEEVRAMFQAGMCSDIEDTIYESYRRLTWESILEQPRRGNVEVVDPVISCTSAGSREETVSEMTGEEITTHN